MKPRDIYQTNMKDFGDASFVLGIKIHRDRSQSILRLSQKSYIERVLSMFGTDKYAPMDTLVSKGDKFSLSQGPKNDIDKEAMQ